MPRPIKICRLKRRSARYRDRGWLILAIRPRQSGGARAAAKEQWLKSACPKGGGLQVCYLSGGQAAMPAESPDNRKAIAVGYLEIVEVHLQLASWVTGLPFGLGCDAQSRSVCAVLAPRASRLHYPRFPLGVNPPADAMMGAWLDAGNFRFEPF